MNKEGFALQPASIPNPYPPEADSFIILYRRVEHALSNQPAYLQNQAKAKVKWTSFAQSLGENFFSYIERSGKTQTILTEPPRVLHSDGRWLPETQTTIKDVNELFVRGVCQVRHNIEHAGKFLYPEEKRSYDLVSEAAWILSQAISRHPQSTNIFPGI